MLFWCLILGFARLSIYKAKTDFKLSKFLLMCLTFYIRFLYFFGMLKKKSIYTGEMGT